MASGKIYITPLARVDELTMQTVAKPTTGGRMSGELTLRQREVLQLVAMPSVTG